MTADERAFLTAIVAHPDADLPRLVFADWLQENGREAYAEFIRVQCEMASVPKWDPAWIRGSWMDYMTWRYGHGRAPDKPRLPGCGSTWNQYRRGFLWQLEVQDPPEFLRAAKRILSQHPVQALHISWLTHQKPNLRGFINAPWMGRLRRLGFHLTHFTGEQFQKFIESADLRSLEEFHLCHGAVDESALDTLAGSQVVQQLRELRLDCNFSEERGQPIVRALAGGLALPRLERLDLSANKMAGEDVLRVLDGVVAPNLTRLEVAGSDLSTPGSAGLAASPRLAGIESLNLDSTSAGAGFLTALARSKHLDQLKILKLRTTELTRALWNGILAADWFAGLHVLQLTAANFGDAGVVALAKSPHAANLRVLSLRVAITDRGAQALLKSPHLGSLIHLDLSVCGVSEKFLATLRARFGGQVGFERRANGTVSATP